MSQFARGAKPSPRHVLAGAIPFSPAVSFPSQYAAVPPRLSMWKNDVEGICVTAEEAFAKAVASVAAGQPELFITDDTVQAWAVAHGVTDGADLAQVMDWMASGGFSQGGTLYNDGRKSSVDYSNEMVLQAAIASGPVKLGIDANALPKTAGNQQGWYAVGGRPGQFANLDHCTGLSSYGTAEFLFAALFAAKLVLSPTPPAAIAGKSGYLHFTWSTIGFVDHAWIMSTVGEAWLRTPTTVLPKPPQPTPGPGPGPTPTGPTLADAIAVTRAAIEANAAHYPHWTRHIATSSEPAVAAALTKLWGGSQGMPLSFGPDGASLAPEDILAIIAKDGPAAVQIIKDLLALAGK